MCVCVSICRQTDRRAERTPLLPPSLPFQLPALLPDETRLGCKPLPHPARRRDGYIRGVKQKNLDTNSPIVAIPRPSQLLPPVPPPSSPGDRTKARGLEGTSSRGLTRKACCRPAVGSPCLRIGGLPSTHGIPGEGGEVRRGGCNDTFIVALVAAQQRRDGAGQFPRMQRCEGLWALSGQPLGPKLLRMYVRWKGTGASCQSTTTYFTATIQGGRAGKSTCGPRPDAVRTWRCQTVRGRGLYCMLHTTVYTARPCQPCLTRSSWHQPR